MLRYNVQRKPEGLEIAIRENYARDALMTLAVIVLAAAGLLYIPKLLGTSSPLAYVGDALILLMMLLLALILFGGAALLYSVLKRQRFLFQKDAIVVRSSLMGIPIGTKTISAYSIYGFGFGEIGRGHGGLQFSVTGAGQSIIANDITEQETDELIQLLKQEGLEYSASTIRPDSEPTQRLFREV